MGLGPGLLVLRRYADLMSEEVTVNLYVSRITEQTVLTVSSRVVNGGSSAEAPSSVSSVNINSSCVHDCRFQLLFHYYHFVHGCRFQLLFLYYFINIFSLFFSLFSNFSVNFR